MSSRTDSLHRGRSWPYIHAAIFCLLTSLANGSAQPFAPPDPFSTAGYGKYIGRTMGLLASSDMYCKRTVRILVYGQSISAQDWWLEVSRDLKERFPNANIVMENRAIGGFSTQYLFKTVEADVASFYPDLVLLHIYGSDKYYDSVLCTIRSRTTAEVAMTTDHFTGENRWSDSMTYHILPGLAAKYHCELLPLRDHWKHYTEKNDIRPVDLTTDGQHLNDQGNFLMAELIKPYLYYEPGVTTDPDKLQTTFRVGRDIDFSGDTLTLIFEGNKVDVVTGTGGFSPADSAWILLDGRRPSEYQGCYFASRPYNTRGDSWPWNLPGMIRVQHLAAWTDEEWKCVFTEAAEPFTDFSFVITGSVTGYDGAGSGTSDFISLSKKVVIRGGDAEDGGDWHLNRSYRVLKTLVLPGDTIRWKTESISSDLYVPRIANDPLVENITTLFQGVANTRHTLRIIRAGRNLPPIREIRVFRPFWNQK